ncbi:E3 ubiquitin/ISG15 ligase TRIM25 [Anabarilius grahami]|uniref:E3 ubiquitin/ISG15 ligase TRIM25 n=1 Tax=Anabarilius grahami TaxID=495550 RepID=A0A3N0XH50_ANAGA|nr:E3 ubiquitin/ISG15 ligase TRIM25 [Anabarilius grahami]
MAESSVSLAQDQFSCSICLDLLRDPVTIPCGHSYCMNCITGCWDQDDQKRVYSCPQCRQTFTPRPVLGKNTMLAEVVETLKKTKLQAARPVQCYTGSGDVECDICTGDKNKAIKSCLVCLNSYCQNHLEQHESFFKGKRHNLMDATGRLQEMICPQHEKLLEIFCRNDQHCICYLCTMNVHKDHKTVSAAAERTEKQRHLEETQRINQQRIQERQKELEDLREAVESHKHSAQAAVEDSERIFTELIRSIERSRSEVKQLIRDQEKAAVSRAEEQLERLEQEIDDLKRRDAELELLSHTDHHIHFLQSFQSLSVPPGSTDSSSIIISSRLSFDDVGKSVSHLREKLEHFCREEIEKISDKCCWDQDDQKRVYSCPQCRQTFTPRPVLGKNTMLAEVVEKLKKTKLQAARPAQCYTESGDVECDVCTGDKNKAIKSCLMICPQHEKLLEIYCRSDKKCINLLCMVDEHKNHKTVSAAAERNEKQRQLEEIQRKFHQRIQERQKELEDLREAVESHKRSAQAAVEDSERIFTELIRSIERSRSEVTQLIRDQEKAAVSRAEEILERLEQEIDDLKRRDAELEQLSHTDHHIHFLQSFQSLSVPLGSTDSSSITVCYHLSFDDVSKSVSHLREKLEHFCREEIENISYMDSHRFTLDANTVHKYLCLSEENRMITETNTDQLYPDHPDRFDGRPQVLCRESACGRCYWEVE